MTLISTRTFRNMLLLREDTACCYKFESLKFIPTFDLVTFINSLNFSHHFNKSGRKSVLFGDVRYDYAGVYHNPMHFTENLFVFEAFTYVSCLFPYLNLNSCLVNYYPDTSCIIPFHSDNESSIYPNSYIITISLGCTRTLTFKKILDSNMTHHEQVTMSNGDVIAFSSNSQSYFSHGLTSEDPIVKIPRISLTFRSLLPLS